MTNEKQSTERYAVVTGANKGIGFETVRQLAASGVTVLLAARNEKRGTDAMASLHGLGLSNVLYHQLDVQDPQSIQALANFVQTKFGRLDILVNNAGASGVVVDEDGLRALNIDPASWLSGKATNIVQGVMITTNEKAKECLDTNYYGVKNLTQALLPLLQRSTSGARIVNVSSIRGELWRIPNEQIRKELGDLASLTEEKIDGFVEKFLHDLSNDDLEANGWSKMLPAYSVSKAMLNAYTRVLARKYPKMCVNCVHPGYVDTDINWHTGTMTVEEGAQGSVMLALLPEGVTVDSFTSVLLTLKLNLKSNKESQMTSGVMRIFKYNISKDNLKRNQRAAAAKMMNEKQSTEIYAVVTGANKGIGFETVRQLAASGVTVLLTARNETRGTDAMASLHGLGLSNVLYHQLDVQDPQSIQALANFVQTKFGRLDILVNNAGASGVVVDEDGLKALNIDPASWLSGKATNIVQGVIITTNEKAKECLDTNYYGVKNLTQALIPLLQRSTSGARIVNVSSIRGELWRIPNEQIRKELGDLASLTEEKIDGFVEKFLHDLSNDELEANGWSKMLPAYSVSKAMLNAYTRVLARKYPKMCVNCVHPGYVDTDINWHTGTMTVEEGAQGSVMLALLPKGGLSGFFPLRTFAMMQHEMESQIHYLEQVAYSSVLRAFKAQSDALSWEKEGLITELRKELRVSDDEHRELLAKVNTDEIITSIREWRSSGGTRSAMLNIPQSIHDPTSPTISASRKRQKINMPLSLPSQSFPALGGGIQTPKPSPRYPLMGRTQRGILPNHGSSVVPIANEANDAGTRDYLVGRKLRTRWPDDHKFYEAVIVDYNPLQVCPTFIWLYWVAVKYIFVA
nr:hypothetical protein [Tanacetum cinerariifolium]